MKLFKFCAAMLVLTAITNGQSSAQEADLLSSTENLDLVNAKAALVKYQGKKAVNLTAIGRDQSPLAVIKNTDFTNGTIEVELAGKNVPGQERGRGFIGIAFHVERQPLNYDCFYLRPANGREADQVRRNHSCQYMHHPDLPFFKSRKETPGKYESYVDLELGAWTKVKIHVDGSVAKLFVHGADQPCLIVNDLKKAGKGGSIALWIEATTDAYFRNLRVVADKPTGK